MPAAETRQAGRLPYGVIIGADGRVRTTEPAGSIRDLHALVTGAGGRLNDDAALDRSTR